MAATRRVDDGHDSQNRGGCGCNDPRAEAGAKPGVSSSCARRPGGGRLPHLHREVALEGPPVPQRPRHVSVRLLLCWQRLRGREERQREVDKRVAVVLDRCGVQEFVEVEAHEAGRKRGGRRDRRDDAPCDQLRLQLLHLHAHSYMHGTDAWDRCIEAYVALGCVHPPLITTVCVSMPSHLSRHPHSRTGGSTASARHTQQYAVLPVAPSDGASQ